MNLFAKSLFFQRLRDLFSRKKKPEFDTSLRAERQDRPVNKSISASSRNSTFAPVPAPRVSGHLAGSVQNKDSAGATQTRQIPDPSYGGSLRRGAWRVEEKNKTPSSDAYLSNADSKANNNANAKSRTRY